MTTDISMAVINAALWLREQVTYKGVAALTLEFNESPIQVTYRAGTGATVQIADRDPVELSDGDLDAEHWTVVA